VPALPLATGERSAFATRTSIGRIISLCKNNLLQEVGACRLHSAKPFPFPGRVDRGPRRTGFRSKLIPEFTTRNQVTAEQVAHLFHVSSATTSAGRRDLRATVDAHHQQVWCPTGRGQPFEHRFNPWPLRTLHGVAYARMPLASQNGVCGAEWL